MTFNSTLKEVSSNVTQNSEKLVILFGWSGSNHKYLSKYSEIFSERKMNTVQMTNTLYIDTNAPKVEILVKEIDEYFQLSKKENFSIYFHVMSNGGLFNYVKALKLIETKSFKHWKPLIKGVIFDSCPGELTATTYSKVLTVQMENFILKTIAYYLILVFIILQSVLSICIPSLRYNTNEMLIDPFLKNTLHDSVPLLIIYSEKDELINHKFIDKLLIQLKSYDKLVFSKKFTDSDHVAHYRKYSKEYLFSIDKLLNNK
jgi:hypothetical protein